MSHSFLCLSVVVCPDCLSVPSVKLTSALQTTDDDRQTRKRSGFITTFSHNHAAFLEVFDDLTCFIFANTDLLSQLSITHAGLIVLQCRLLLFTQRGLTWSHLTR